MRKDNQIFLIVLFITLVAITSCSVFFSLVNLSNNGGSMIEETSYSMPVFDLTSSEIINSSSEITDSSKKEISIIEETSTTIIKEESSIKSPERYPEATKIWNILRSWDWTPETCAGIIGNMMAEVSGGTLDLSHWDLDEPTGFGLIQWLDGRKRALQERYGSIPSIEE